MTAKLGSRVSVKGKPYVIRSILANGRIVLEPARPGYSSDGSIWTMGEECRVVDLAKKELTGIVVNLDPIETKVITPGQWQGRIVGRFNMRKAK